MSIGSHRPKMATSFEQRIPARKALLEFGSIYIMLGLGLLAVRSVARVWVDSVKMDSPRGAFFIPYAGELLLAVAFSCIGGGILLMCMHYSIRSSAGFDISTLRAATRLTIGGVIGIGAAGISQAWLHIGRLAIPEGWMHPRSLVITCLSALIAGAILFFMGSRRENL